MQDTKRVWVWVGVVVVVLGVVVALVWPRSKPSGPTTSTNGPAPVYAPQGQLTPEFPKQLILDSAAAVNQSYSIGYSSSTNQYTAQFNTSSSVATLYASYKKYLPANGWTITNDIAKYAQSRGIYASNASSDVMVAILAQGSGSQVTVTYIIK